MTTDEAVEAIQRDYWATRAPFGALVAGTSYLLPRKRLEGRVSSSPSRGARGWRVIISLTEWPPDKGEFLLLDETVEILEPCLTSKP